MFIFSKSKKHLADIIPNGCVDIHSHLLPGIDDGAENEQDTLSLIKSLQSFGFAEFVTTPHILTGVWNNTREGIMSKEASTLIYLHDHQINIPFKAAAEYLMDDTFLTLIKTNQPLLTVKDNYVLVEMSYLNPPMQLYDIIYELQLREYQPILAHPERYLFYHFKPQEYKKLKQAGCLFQVNLLSTTGYYGKPVFETCKKLLDENMIDFAGSDTHHERHTNAFKSTVLLKSTDNLIAALNNNSLFSS